MWLSLVVMILKEKYILCVDLWWGGIFISKVDLVDAYMRVWIIPEDILRLSFIVPPYPVNK